MDIDTININVDVSTPTDPVEVTPTPAGPQGPPGPRGIPGERGESGQPGRDGAIQYTAGDNITIENDVISAIIPNTIATKQYVDDAIASAITDALGGSY